MFYCGKCAEKNNWPESIGKSRGVCEVCGKPGVCNDRPSRTLPAIQKTSAATKKNENE